MADRAGDVLGRPERCDEVQCLLLDPQQVRVDGAAGQDERIVVIRPVLRQAGQRVLLPL